MSWTAWLFVAAVGTGVLASLFLPELLHVPGKLLDRLSPKFGIVILGTVIVVCALVGLAMMHGRSNL